MAPNDFGISFARHELPKTLFLLGGYTDKSVLAHNPAGGEGDGVYSVLFDPMLGKIQILKSSKVETNPAFIMKHPRLDIVYMTTEVIDRGSEVLVGRVDRKSGQICILDRKKVYGRSTCHIEWDAARSHLIAVSYWDSKITTFPVKQDGMLADATQVYSDPGSDYVDTEKPDRDYHLAHRQGWPHLHQVNRDPYSNGKVFMVPDLGRDQIHYFKIQEGVVEHLGVDQLVPGGGPRHMDFNKRQKVVYICGELNNTVTVLKYKTDSLSQVLRGNFTGDVNSSTGLLSQVQVVSSVPSNLTTKSTIAEMRLHPSGKFLFVGNRGHNSIAVFRVSSEDGTLSLVTIQSSLGAFPRHFNFDNTGNFLLVGNHASDMVVAFRICESGKLEVTDKVEGLPSIVWLTPVEPDLD